jgi:tRNA(Ile2) C34 agmatinyltransferase TiaS
MSNNAYIVNVKKGEEPVIPVISKEQMKHFKEEVNKYIKPYPDDTILSIDNNTLTIENFMGGRLILPMQPKCRVYDPYKNEDVKVSSYKQIKMFMDALWQTKGVPEVFAMFGAKIEIDKKEDK